VDGFPNPRAIRHRRGRHSPDGISAIPSTTTL
jgi:hypothetical protein